MSNAFDFVNSIMTNKKNLMEEEDRDDYPPFFINKALSMHKDLIFLANQMNQYHDLDKDIQYRFFLNTVKPLKRYAKWVKRENDSDVDLISRYYGMNKMKAKQVSLILTDEQKNFIRKQVSEYDADG